MLGTPIICRAAGGHQGDTDGMRRCGPMLSSNLLAPLHGGGMHHASSQPTSPWQRVVGNCLS